MSLYDTVKLTTVQTILSCTLHAASSFSIAFTVCEIIANYGVAFQSALVFISITHYFY